MMSQWIPTRWFFSENGPGTLSQANRRNRGKVEAEVKVGDQVEVRVEIKVKSAKDRSV